MKFDDERLSRIFDRTDGRCHICGKRLAFRNYARPRSKGAWEVEHSIARARGGSDRLNNLYAACISCNRSKQHGSTRSARDRYGRTCAPLSLEKRRTARVENAILGGAAGLLLTTGSKNPLAQIGAVLVGARLGYKSRTD